MLFALDAVEEPHWICSLGERDNHAPVKAINRRIIDVFQSSWAFLGCGLIWVITVQKFLHKPSDLTFGENLQRKQIHIHPSILSNFYGTILDD